MFLTNGIGNQSRLLYMFLSKDEDDVTQIPLNGQIVHLYCTHHLIRIFGRHLKSGRTIQTAPGLPLLSAIISYIYLKKDEVIYR